MPAPKHLPPVVLAAIGLLLVATGVWLDGPAPLDAAAIAVGVGTLLVGGLWLEHRRASIESLGDLARCLLSLVGFVALFGAIGEYGLDRTTRVTLGVVGLVLLVAVGYRTYAKELPGRGDERERTIRYRAVYNGFLVVCGILFGSTVLAFVAAEPSSEQFSQTSLLGVGAFALLALGGLVVLVSEGWYRARM